MTRWFWIDGRFSWAFVAVVVFLTASLIIADYTWRILVMPIDKFALYAIAADVMAAVVLIALALHLRRRATAVSKS